MGRKKPESSEVPPKLPPVWDYTDYRNWLTDTFKARKAIHSWYSYGVLAQRAGFKARDYLMRVMRGERGLSLEGAVRLSEALDLTPSEKEYFLALVEYNQASKDETREAAWHKLQRKLVQSRYSAHPRKLASIQKQLLSKWHHLAIRSLIELSPVSEDWEALGRRLFPPRSAAMVRKSIRLLERSGLIEKSSDGLWRATDKSIAISPEVGGPALKTYHKDCMGLAERALDALPGSVRHISGLTLAISRPIYEQLCHRIEEIHLEFSRIADRDESADQLYHLNLSFFPMSAPPEETTP
jgi:uncharacterized protein (TIGR02147 family)